MSPPVEARAELTWRDHSSTQGNDYPEPRYGQGAFQEALRAVWKRTTGQELQATTGGKPTRLTYEHAERLLLAQANHPEILPPGSHEVQKLGCTFMVGLSLFSLALSLSRYLPARKAVMVVLMRCFTCERRSATTPNPTSQAVTRLDFPPFCASPSGTMWVSRHMLTPSHLRHRVRTGVFRGKDNHHIHPATTVQSDVLVRVCKEPLATGPGPSRRIARAC